MPSQELQNKIKELNKKMAIGGIQFGVEFEDIDRIPFSSPRLQYMTYGGVPVGRIVEFSGDDGSGKTTTTLDLIKSAQKKFEDKQVVFCDIERTFDTVWATKMGVNLDELIYYNPENQDAETVFNNLLALADTGSVSLIILDSIGAMVSRLANEKQIGERTYGGIAMALTEFAKKITPICVREKCTFIGINQMRDDMNSSYGGETTTGGKNWRHQCSMRIQFRKGEFLDEKGNKLSRSCENPVGNLVYAHLLKSKVCPPDRKMAFYTLNYYTGIDYIMDSIDVAVKVGTVVQSGAWYSIVETKVSDKGELIEEVAKYEDTELKFQGKAKLADFLRDHEDFYNNFFEEINKKM